MPRDHMMTSTSSAQQQLGHAIKLARSRVEKELADAFAQWSASRLSRVNDVVPHILYVRGE